MRQRVKSIRNAALKSASVAAVGMATFAAIVWFGGPELTPPERMRGVAAGITGVAVGAVLCFLLRCLWVLFIIPADEEYDPEPERNQRPLWSRILCGAPLSILVGLIGAFCGFLLFAAIVIIHDAHALRVNTRPATTTVSGNAR
jgi:hypothetical protein